MDAVLTIEDAEVARLAEELAGLRRVSLRDAVADARRTRIGFEWETARRKARIEQIARKMRAHLIEPVPSSDHKWFYAEAGRPI